MKTLLDIIIWKFFIKNFFTEDVLLRNELSFIDLGYIREATIGFDTKNRPFNAIKTGVDVKLRVLKYNKNKLVFAVYKQSVSHDNKIRIFDNQIFTLYKRILK